MAVSGAVYCRHQDILKLVLVLDLKVFDDIVPVFPLSSGFKVENKLENESLHRGKGVKLPVEGLGEGKLCAPLAKYNFPDT